MPIHPTVYGYTIDLLRLIHLTLLSMRYSQGMICLANVNTKYSGITTRTLIGEITPTAQTTYALSESVRNFHYIEVIFRNGSYGNFVNRIMSTDSLGIGNAETLSFTAYNNSSYNFYAECGFIADTSFRISTFRSTGWTISKVFVVGILRAAS